jgi:hypothetical protein
MSAQGILEILRGRAMIGSLVDVGLNERDITCRGLIRLTDGVLSIYKYVQLLLRQLLTTHL